MELTLELDRAELGDFLRRRREGLRPADVGLPAGSRRRTPGLRRDEVATLANMSTDYYERLEQARAPQPSAPLLAGIARALQLTTDERNHLYLLAGHAPPASIGTGPVIDPGLAYVLAAVAPTTPGSISDDLGDVLAQNPLNTALFGVFVDRPDREPNLIWRWFTSPAWRVRLRSASPAEEEATGLAYVADLRATLAQRGHDEAAATLVAQLQSASPEFAAMWDQHRVSTLHCTTKSVLDERVGRLDLDCALVLSPLSTQRLLLLQPVAGTDTAGRLERLYALLTGDLAR